MEKGVTYGYRERLFEGRYPVCFLFLEVDPRKLDVNIHPNKREVRFDEEGRVAEFIGEAIYRALSSKDAVVDVADQVYSRMDKLEGIPSFMKDDRRSGNLFRSGNGVSKSEGEQVNIKSILGSMENKPASPAEPVRETRIVKEPLSEEPERKIMEPGIYTEPEVKASDERVSDFTFKEAKLNTPVGTMRPRTDDRETIPVTRPVTDQRTPIEIYTPLLKPFDFNELWVTGCVFDTYITATDANNFYLIDQHAAQERVFYEKLVNEYEAGEKVRQTILVPLILNVDYSQLENQDEWRDPLTEMGFTIEDFGGNAFRITEIPMFMEMGEADEFLKEFLANVKTGVSMRNTVVINKLIMMSCKAAIKAHDKLSLNEMKALLKDLANCRNPFSCPHGRPTAIKLTQYDLEKMFKRVQ